MTAKIPKEIDKEKLVWDLIRLREDFLKFSYETQEWLLSYLDQMDKPFSDFFRKYRDDIISVS